MSLSAEQQATLIENTVQAIVKEHMLPYMKDNLDNLVRKHVFDALSFIYRDEISEHIRKTIRADLVNQFEITVKLKGS